jgi:hypothetical protein
MTTPSDPTAALAEALHVTDTGGCHSVDSVHAPEPHDFDYEDAAAILAALPAPWRLTAEPEAAEAILAWFDGVATGHRWADAERALSRIAYRLHDARQKVGRDRTPPSHPRRDPGMTRASSRMPECR